MRLSLRILLLFVFLQSCAPRPEVKPASVPLDQLAQEAATPQRAASMRLVDQGRREFSQQRFERAANLLSRAVEIDSSNPFAYFYLGLVRSETGRFTQARDLFERAGDLFQSLKNWQAEAYAEAGECMEKLSKPDQARAYFQKAYERDPSNQRALEGLKRVGA